MIKNLLLYILVFFAFELSELNAQCTGGTNAGALTPTISPAWQTLPVNGFNYYTFVATAGRIYHFSFCSAYGNGSSTRNTYITILNSSGVPVPNGFNDDFCGQQSYVAWTCPTTATYRVLLNRNSCSTNNGSLGTLAYRYTLPLTCSPLSMGTGVTSVTTLPYASGTGTTCGAGDDLNITNVIACGSSNYLEGEDKVWIFTPAATGNVTIASTSGGSSVGLFLFKGCPLIGQGGSCVGVSQSSSGNQTITACLQSGQTYYVILDVFPNPTCQAYTNLTISAPAAVGTCSPPGGVIAIPAIPGLPYTSVGQTTCGKGNDLTTSNVVSCGSGNYLTGEDVLYSFTPASSGVISIALTSTGIFTGLMLYEGCPLSSSCSGTPPICVAFSQNSTGNKTLCAAVTSGKTYYLIVDSWATPACNPYSITIGAPTATVAGATCATAVPISSLPFSAINESTTCTGNDYTNSSTGSCGTIYESGEDKVYQYVATSSECLGISITGASSNSIGFSVYSGCPGSVGSSCIGSVGGATSGSLSSSITLPSAGTYFIIIDSWAPPSDVSYNLSISTFGSGPSNDLPCNATPLTLGSPVLGTNSCSGSASEPATLPACWVTPNNRNTVWYSAIAPASGQLRIRVIPGTLANPQVAIYRGTCGTGMTYINCNDDGPTCGSSITLAPDLAVSGLTAGATYYIALDGVQGQTGTFNILVIDGSLPLPTLTNGQDCGTYLPVCSQQLSFGNPGFQSYGNTCDFPGGGGNCLLAGERSSVWIEVVIASPGNLNFVIVPKDWAGAPSTVSTDYDFAVWKIAGTGATTCAGIAGGAAPVKCNYSFYGVTGLNSAANGTAPAAYPGFGAGFTSQLAVTAGDRYVILVSNFSNSTSGFDLIFDNASFGLLNSAASTEAIWSGGADVDWNKPANWGGCPLPSCTRNGVINGGFTNQPLIFLTDVNVKTLTINPGANLAISSGRTLNVCEDLINNGSLAASTTSTIKLIGTGNDQDIRGNFTGSNAMGNLTIAKTGGGIVSMFRDLDVKRDFIQLSNTPITTFDVDGFVHRVGGAFAVYNAYLPDGGTLDFFGSAAQSYSDFYASSTGLNNVLFNHTGTGVTLGTNMRVGTTGKVTFNSGKLITNALELNVTNPAPNSVSVGNSSSYVIGNLRRSINATGSYDFPLGLATKGYQRANINFDDVANPTSIANIRATFVPNTPIPAPLGVTECSATYSNPALDNGKWRFQANANEATGKFDLTLYNTGYTNAISSQGWTIMSSTNAGTTWALASGSCVPSTVTAVSRLNMSGISRDFGVAQSPNTTLPVEWLSFNAKVNERSVQLVWATASEDENKGFEVYRADDSNNFNKIGWVNGGGNSSSVLNYSFLDDKVQKDIMYYYRLNQIDMDGTVNYSPIVAVKLNSSKIKVALFPNPITEITQLHYELEENSTINISLVNPIGEEVRTIKSGTQEAGLHSLSINPNSLNLANGLYTIRLVVNGQASFYKLIISQ
jgi:hypothetical protein